MPPKTNRPASFCTPHAAAAQTVLRLLEAPWSADMKIKSWVLLLVAAIGVSAIFGWPYIRNSKAPVYQTARVTVGDVASTVAATGNLNAVVTVQVGSQVSGNIKALYA